MIETVKTVMNAAEVAAALDRAPVEASVYVRLPSASIRFPIERIECSTEGRGEWVVEVVVSMNAGQAV